MKDIPLRRDLLPSKQPPILCTTLSLRQASHGPNQKPPFARDLPSHRFDFQALLRTVKVFLITETGAEIAVESEPRVWPSHGVKALERCALLCFPLNPPPDFR